MCLFLVRAWTSITFKSLRRSIKDKIINVEILRVSANVMMS